MVSVKISGSFSNTKKLLESSKKMNIRALEKYAKQGIDALSSATPVDSGLTASSWYYTITTTSSTATINFLNSNVQQGWANIAILLQYGHATKNGGWVQGRDYINPAMRPIFDNLAKKAWWEVFK